MPGPLKPYTRVKEIFCAKTRNIRLWKAKPRGNH